ncbi:MAG TPA: UDP-2,3-diacylglucosamine diphosphatase [Terriglobales bacterium]|nr:UDP-2,3-diacylglucosamine diphosphatase [Terriglobales bacterium]
MVHKYSAIMAEALVDTLLISDLHLGSEVSRARDALDLIQSLTYRRLILLGDIFSDLNFRRLNGDHWKFLSCIRKLSNPKRKVEVIWVEGNHDFGLSNVMSHLVGVPVYQRFVWEYSQKRHLAIHGHQFDTFIKRNPYLVRFGEFFYHDVIQKLDRPSKCVSRFVDRLNTRFSRMSPRIMSGALAYAKAGNINRVFCGHTHVAVQAHVDGIAYYNTGSWIDARATYVTVGEEGVNICEYSGGIDHRNSGKERSPELAVPADLFDQAGLPAYAAYQSVRC